MPQQGMYTFSAQMIQVKVPAFWYLWVAFPFGKMIIMCAKIYTFFCKVQIQ